MPPGVEGVWARDPVTGEWDPERPYDPPPERAPPRTFRQRLRRIRCWWRGWHAFDSSNVGKFRYDVNGMCNDCGKVGTGHFVAG